MLVYRAVLRERVQQILSVSARTAGPAPDLGGGGRGYQHRVRLRYVTPSGRVLSHRGMVWAAWPSLAVAGYQQEGQEVWVSFVPAPLAGASAPGPGAPGPLAVAAALPLYDRFTLPLEITAWPVSALSAVQLKLFAAARTQGNAIAVRGVLRAEIRTPGGPLRLRVPFIRLIGLAGEAGGPQWRLLAALSDLRLSVQPGGQIQGEVGVRLTLRPPGVVFPQLRLVRQILGRIRRVTARMLEQDLLLVEGILDVDLYWVDQQGRSRWSGHALPFSSLVESPLASPPPGGTGEALDTAAHLEPVARVNRLVHRHEGDGIRLEAHLQLSVTILRDRTGWLKGEQYRLQQVLGTAEKLLLLTERLVPTAGGGAGTSAAGGPDTVEQGITVQGEPGGTEIVWAEAGPGPAPGPDRRLEGEIDLPGPVRTLWGAALLGGLPHAGGALPVVEVLVGDSGGLHLVSGPFRPAGEPAAASVEGRRLLAVPVNMGDRWRLRLWLDLA